MLIGVVVLSYVLARQPRRFNSLEDGHVVTFDSNSQTIDAIPSVRPEVSVAVGLEAALAKDLASIPDVRHVLTERADGNLLVWIAIDNSDSYEIRSQVYEKELGLMDGFPEVSFDFNLVSALNRNPKELATGARIVYSRA